MCHGLRARAHSRLTGTWRITDIPQKNASQILKKLKSILHNGMKTYALTLAAAAAVLSAVTARAAAPEADALPAPVSVTPGAVYSLDSCRSMALVNNKKLMMTRQRMRKAEYENK